MTPKEIRKRILEILYEKRSDDFNNPEDLIKLIGVSEESLDAEIRYLDEKYLLKIMGEYMGKRFLNFAGVKITSQGIDLVEDPEEFNKLFTIKISNNNFGNVSNSNLNINSERTRQEVSRFPEDKMWYRKWWGKIIIGVITGVIISLIGLFIK